MLWDKASNEQGRNFINKLWNALKLIQIWKERAKQNLTAEEVSLASDWPHQWFEARLRAASSEIDVLMAQYKLSEALKTLYSLIWDDFCSWYLEWVKPGFEKPMDQAHLDRVLNNFEMLLERLHPFMPFVTEEIYQLLRSTQSVDLCVRQLDTTLQPHTEDANYLKDGELLKAAITAIRDARVK